MTRRYRNLTLIHLLLLFFASLLWAQTQTSDDLAREEAEDYYRKWLNEDVVYIIRPEEEAVFKQLTTPEEKEQFIEQFWFRRDPDPTTASNEFKEEHYRRIAYANERFASGLPGWMTDRGRVYIIHGKPAEIESYPAGGSYQRPSYEGGGSTTVYPFEIWRYRHIEGIGTDVEIEFVDPSMSGEYRLALNPEEKDAMLFVPGAGQTLAEELGLATKADRPYFSPGNRDRYPMMYQRAQDSPFERYDRYAAIQRPASIKYQDLKEMVTVDIGYDSIPLSVREDYFRLNDQQILVPITVMVPNRNLTFKPEGASQTARVQIYGIITSITNRIITEFEDDLVASFSAGEATTELQKFSIYQKVVPLDAKLRYKIDLIVKDANSGQVGAVRRAISPPSFSPDELSTSSFLLADSIRPLDAAASPNEMFVIGDVKVRPNVTGEFTNRMGLGLYFHVYNTAFDQTTFEPSLRITYRLFRDGEIVQKAVDETGDSIQFFSSRRVVLARALSLEALESGDYQITVEVEDLLSHRKVEVSDRFKIVDSRLG